MVIGMTNRLLCMVIAFALTSGIVAHAAQAPQRPLTLPAATSLPMTLETAASRIGETATAAIDPSAAIRDAFQRDHVALEHLRQAASALKGSAHPAFNQLILNDEAALTEIERTALATTRRPLPVRSRRWIGWWPGRRPSSTASFRKPRPRNRQQAPRNRRAATHPGSRKATTTLNIEVGPMRIASPVGLNHRRPHLAGVGALWVDRKFFFTSGPGTRKSRNLAVNPNCALSMALPGLDLVVEGRATKVTDQATLERLAQRYAAQGWPARATAGAITAEYSAPSAGPPPWDLYEVTPITAFGTATAKPYGATRWRFDERNP